MIKATRKKCVWKGCFIIKVVLGRLGKEKSIIITQEVVTVKYREAYFNRESQKLDSYIDASRSFLADAPQVKTVTQRF